MAHQEYFSFLGPAVVLIISALSPLKHSGCWRGTEQFSTAKIPYYPTTRVWTNMA
ncbi:hypothetical protein FOIG_14522 [Fusarium odoratissimum NRRL 54006]|uniref:Uncharacterized protein n=1 Tax=Fusarium odoratissimum (strain NRRL 54006) TaxID=1089451 RepID=X0ITW2_FUSO5|nr:uncharacterized protein FOIG_14522 [Fusarium odoratissimum NRRL 54006]EXL92312.1 hypothetical protein FOIG_14522 [Fusarium odoratissimum NRRL 54006]